MFKFLRQNKIFLICVSYAVISVIFFGLLFHWQGIVNYDTDGYVYTARNLLQQRFFSVDGITPDYNRTPGYPLFLAAIYALGGNDTCITLIQIFLAGLEIYLLYRILLTVGTAQKYALIGAILMLFNLTSYQYSWNIAPDFLFGFLLTLALFFLTRYFYGKHRSSDFTLFTFVFNYALLVRPILVYFNMLTIIILIVFWLRKKISGQYPLIFALCFLLCWGGWSYRNYKHSGVFIYSTISNYNMLKYNCPPITAWLKKISEKDASEYHDQIFAQKYPEAPKLNQAELSLRQKAYGFEFVRAHFAVFVLLSILGLFGALFGVSRAFLFSTFPALSAYLLGSLYFIYLSSVYLLYIAGLIKNWRKSSDLLQLYIFLLSSYLVLPGAIMANSRFRAPFFTLILIGMTVNLNHFFRQKRRGSLPKNSKTYKPPINI
jgi:4-amino-4-deoxy-L-arabinose transferase-like glycosyltransferase